MPTLPKDFEAYSVGICAASICTSLPIDTAVQRMNMEHPTGISSKWQLSDDKTFKGGEINGCPCDREPKTHRHYLLNC